jgi:glycosyltransferase involved in cell wall biosynthesis
LEISVIIPVYNSSETLKKCFDSVYKCLNEHFAEFEVILIDDGSVDDSFAIMKALKQMFPDEVIIIQQSNLGAAAARNAGLDICKGMLVGFNDSDDVWLLEGLTARLHVLKHNQQVDCVAANHDKEKQKFPFLKAVSSDLFKISFNSAMFKCYFAPPTVLMRRSVIDAGYRFNPELTHAEEGHFFNHVVSNFECIFLNKMASQSITQKYRFGDGGLSGNLIAMHQGELSNLRNAYDCLHHNLVLFYLSVIFSYLKYFRRILIVRLRK